MYVSASENLTTSHQSGKQFFFYQIINEDYAIEKIVYSLMAIKCTFIISLE